MMSLEYVYFLIKNVDCFAMKAYRVKLNMLRSNEFNLFIGLLLVCDYYMMLESSTASTYLHATYLSIPSPCYARGHVGQGRAVSIRSCYVLIFPTLFQLSPSSEGRPSHAYTLFNVELSENGTAFNRLFVI